MIKLSEKKHQILKKIATHKFLNLSFQIHFSISSSKQILAILVKLGSNITFITNTSNEIRLLLRSLYQQQIEINYFITAMLFLYESSFRLYFQ